MKEANHNYTMAGSLFSKHRAMAIVLALLLFAMAGGACSSGNDGQSTSTGESSGATVESEQATSDSSSSSATTSASPSEATEEPETPAPSLTEEDARKALVVAVNNSLASDVFASDGNTYDPSLFHSYSAVQTTGVRETDDGEVAQTADGGWSITSLGLVEVDKGVETNREYTASATIHYDGTNYVVSGLSMTYKTYALKNPGTPGDYSVDPFGEIQEGDFPLMVSDGDLPLVVSPDLLN